MLKARIMSTVAMVYLGFLGSLLPAFAGTDSRGMSVLLRGVDLTIPDSFVVDLRYASAAESRIAFRENIDGQITGRTIGLSFIEHGDNVVEAFEETGYSRREVCGFQVFEHETSHTSHSIVVLIEQGMIHLTNLQKELIDEVFESLCQSVNSEDRGTFEID